MAIAIHCGVRYRFQWIFKGVRFRINRYEQEGSPGDWMYVVIDGLTDAEMQVDGEDADLLSALLDRLEEAEVTEATIEETLLSWFREHDC